MLHINGPEENLLLLKKAYDALVPGGQVVVHDFILNAEKTAPRAGALFALNMLVNTQKGNAYSEPEYRAWLEAAGFEGIALLPLPGPTDLIVGTRP